MNEYNFYRFIDDKSILVITPKYKLIRIRCPFAVVDSDKKLYQVDAVIEKDHIIYYKIDGTLSAYASFKIFK